MDSRRSGLSSRAACGAVFATLLERGGQVDDARGAGRRRAARTLTESDVSTAVLAWEADADVSQGYSVYLVADHEMRSTVSASTVLTAVADGTVSAGSTEYGARSSDTSLTLSTFDTVDTAITTSLQQIASRGDNTLEARDFLTLKAAVANGATSAEYTQELTVLFVGDY